MKCIKISEVLAVMHGQGVSNLAVLLPPTAYRLQPEQPCVVLALTFVTPQPLIKSLFASEGLRYSINVENLLNTRKNEG